MPLSEKMVSVKRALISLSDKTGIVDFARGLQSLNIEIISTGGTATLLRENNIDVTEVSEYTGFPEIMNGRVKTLHPKIHGALLGRPGIDDQVMGEHGIIPINLIVVNLYPFLKIIQKNDCLLSTAIENIDIGGPTMIRAAAKNFNDVATLVDQADYQLILDELVKNHSQLSINTRFMLTKKAFAYTAEYDAAITNYLTSLNDELAPTCFPTHFHCHFTKKQTLRYGENPHQRAALYSNTDQKEVTLVSSTQLQGKELSYNNIADADAALQCVKSFNEQPTCVIVKHANPCGVAIDQDLLLAYQRAFDTDPTSAFGGIIAFNHTVTGRLALTILKNQFVELIIAPDFDKDAQAHFAAKPNIRLLSTGFWKQDLSTHLDFKVVSGGLLVQDSDNHSLSNKQIKTVSQRSPSEQELSDLLFSWTVAKFVKSNAIVYAKNGTTVGIGAGQMSRVDSARIASLKASDIKQTISGAVMASDAFFPFQDAIETAANAGISAIIQPGGSIRDKEIIAAADAANIAMVFTGIRHFRH